MVEGYIVIKLQPLQAVKNTLITQLGYHVQILVKYNFKYRLGFFRITQLTVNYNDRPWRDITINNSTRVESEVINLGQNEMR